MAGQRIISKQLAGAEDILLDASGEATVVQERASGPKTITKVNASTIPYEGKRNEVGFKSTEQALVERARTVSTIEEMLTVNGAKEDTVVVKDLDRGGVFIYDASKLKTEANDGTIFASLYDAGAEVGCWVRQYSTAASFKWFGAKGDGITDDTISVNKALNSSVSALDGSLLSYKITEPINIARGNIVVTNTVIDASRLPDIAGSPDYIINCTGEQGRAYYLASDALRGSNTITLSSVAGITEDSFIFISSDHIFESSQTVKLGQVAKIKSLDSSTNKVYLYNDILYDFTLAENANISVLYQRENIRFENCTFLGASQNYQSMLNFHLCNNVVVENCKFDLCDYVACRISRTVDFKASNCTVTRARAAGTAYGFAIANGSYGVTVANSYGEDLRHFVSVGDNDGVNLFVRVIGNHISACLDAGIDSHAACDYMVIDGNTIEGSAYDSGQLDGIIFQGLNCVVTNNIIVGARRYSVFFQPLPDSLYASSSIIQGNSISNSGGSDNTEAAICVMSYKYVSILNISNNIIDGANDYAIYVSAYKGDISDIVISGNSFSHPSYLKGVFVRAYSGMSVDKLSICDNISTGSAVGEGIYLLGSTGEKNIKNAVIKGNIIDNFLLGVRLTDVDGVAIGNNRVINYSDIYKIVDCLDVNINDTHSLFVSTASTYVVDADNDDIIVDRAGDVIFTLPSPSEFSCRVITITKRQSYLLSNNVANIIAVDGTVSDVILATTESSTTIKSDGTNWVRLT